LTLARDYGELKLDAVILVDKDLASLGPNHYPKIQPVLKTLCNLVRFYDAPVIIHTERVSAENLQHLLQLEVDGFSLGNPISHMADAPSLAGMLLGGCLPSSALLGSAEDIQAATLELVSGSSTKRLFITSESEVPRETPATNLHRVMQILETTSV